MNIVDAQIHLGPGGISETLAAMDALGIAAALLDEYWVEGFSGKPYHALPNGALRPVCPTAELAAQQYPNRFSWLLRIHRLDTESAAIVRQVRDAPNGRALRIDPGLSPEELERFAVGGYDHILAAASDAGLPIFVFAPDSPDAFARAARAFPDCRIVIDHCGLYSNSMRSSFARRKTLDEAGQGDLFARVMELSAFPNLHLKWGHASAMFDTPAWPGIGLRAPLRQALCAFGARRVMWASDFSVNQRGESWAELLFGPLSDPGLSEDEKAAFFGGALRELLDWPV